MTSKRTVPSSVQSILKFDSFLTNNFCVLVSKFINLTEWRTFFKALEISCHGVCWIFLSLLSVWIIWNPELFESQLNFIMGLLVDVTLVAVSKAYFRRKRPSENKSDMLLTVSLDDYSFPSGHVSRAFFVSYFFTYLSPVGVLLRNALHVWAALVALTRVLMKRHFLLDVLGGIILGFLVFSFVSLFWLSRSTSLWIIEFITDEKLEGGEYHV